MGEKAEKAAVGTSRAVRPKTSQAKRKTGPVEPARPIETRDDLRERYQALLDEATAILAEARNRGDSRLALQALKEARESILHIGKALGLIVPDGAVTIDNRSVSVELHCPTCDGTRALADATSSELQRIIDGHVLAAGRPEKPLGGYGTRSSA